MSEHHGHAKPQHLPMTDEEWHLLQPRGREVMLSLWQQIEQLKKSLAEQRLNTDLTALFGEAKDVLATSAQPRAGKRVLVADDSAIIRKLVRNLAEKAGSQLFEAQDGAEALKIIQEQEVDLLILDINMPKINGIQVLQALRAHDRYKQLPVVMLTTSSSAHDVREAIAGRVLAYLLKDNREDLATKLLQHMQAP